MLGISSILKQHSKNYLQKIEGQISKLNQDDDFIIAKYEILKSNLSRDDKLYLVSRWENHYNKYIVGRRQREVLRRTTRKNKFFTQEDLYRSIIYDPERYYYESMATVSKRIEIIQSAYENLTEKYKNYAKFNLQFFVQLLDNDRFENLSLVDDVGYFNWPDFEIKKLRETRSQNLWVGFSGEIHGLLFEIGYNARQDGPDRAKRRQILSAFFGGHIRIPQRYREHYVFTWSESGTSSRLKRMAYVIATFVWQQKGRAYPSHQAIQKWTDDLEYLREKYYAKFTSKFNWLTP